jgi:flagellin-like protein
MGLKGISPLVATVLLIGVTMAIAGLLAVFGQNLVSEQLSASLDEPVAGECGFGNFVVDRCSYNSTSQAMILVLHNVGTVNLNNISASIDYGTNITNTPVLGALASGSRVAFTASGIQQGFSKVVVLTSCVNVYKEIATCS